MASARFVNRLVIRGLITITVILTFCNEVLIYYINQSFWQKINCKKDNCTRLLLIADPQLLGKTYDKSFYNPLARFDADRYLRKTFERALDFTQPHIICFLGDLLDEGNVANTLEFREYADRFKSIYSSDNNKIRYIHVPGDNDIGGEGSTAYISNTNVHRFELEFALNDIFDYDNRIRFFKINRMLLDFTNPDSANNDSHLRIGLSHAPILIGGGPLLRSIIKDLDPHIIFSGHWHESRIFVHPSTKIINFYENSVREFNLKTLKEQDHTYIEIMVPTASYRMGRNKMGLGFAVLENYNLKYTVLWLPNRFILLFIYVFWLLFALCILIVFKMMTRCPFRFVKREKHYNRVSTLAQF